MPRPRSAAATGQDRGYRRAVLVLCLLLMALLWVGAGNLFSRHHPVYGAACLAVSTFFAVYPWASGRVRSAR